jgi:archaellum biogenesis protein FlaJ (TadC family)
VARGSDMSAAPTLSVLCAAITACLLVLLLVARKPGDVLVHNERIKSVSTALNNLGVAAFVYGGIAPTLGGTVGNTAWGFALGVIFVAGALLVLRFASAG